MKHWLLLLILHCHSTLYYPQYFDTPVLQGAASVSYPFVYFDDFAGGALLGLLGGHDLLDDQSTLTKFMTRFGSLDLTHPRKLDVKDLQSLIMSANS